MKKITKNNILKERKKDFPKNDILKYFLLAIAILLLALIVFFILKNPITGKVINLTNPDDPLGIGLNADDLPASPEELGSFGYKYLEEQWLKIITTNKVISPIHNYCTNHPFIFQILFAEEYSSTFRFLWMIILWIFIAALAADLFYASGFNSWSIFFGVGTSLVFAQLRIIKGFVNIIMWILSKPDSWWIQIIAVLIIIAVLAIIRELFKQIKVIVIQKKKAMKQKRTEKKVSNAHEIAKEAKEKAETANEKIDVIEEAIEPFEELGKE